MRVDGVSRNAYGYEEGIVSRSTGVFHHKSSFITNSKQVRHSGYRDPFVPDLFIIYHLIVPVCQPAFYSFRSKPFSGLMDASARRGLFFGSSASRDA